MEIRRRCARWRMAAQRCAGRKGKNWFIKAQQSQPHRLWQHRLLRRCRQARRTASHRTPWARVHHGRRRPIVLLAVCILCQQHHASRGANLHIVCFRRPLLLTRHVAGADYPGQQLHAQGYNHQPDGRSRHPAATEMLKGKSLHVKHCTWIIRKQPPLLLAADQTGACRILPVTESTTGCAVGLNTATVRQ